MTHCYVCFETLKHATLTWAVAARLQAEATTHTHIEDAYIQGARNAAGQHVRPLTPAPNHTQIILPSPMQHTRAAECAVGAVSEPFNLTGKPSTNFIDAPWVCTHVWNLGSEFQQRYC